MDRWKSPGPDPVSNLPTAARRAADRCADRTGENVHRWRRLWRRRIALSRGGFAALGRRNGASDNSDDDGSGEHQYAIIAVGVQGHRTTASGATKSRGRAKLRWDSGNGAD